MSASIIGTLKAILSLDSRQFEQGAKRAQGAAGTLKMGIASVAQAAAGLAAGVASVQTLSASVAQARQFGAALAETSTLIAGTAEEMRALSEGARELARAYGTDATEQVRAYYQAISAGVGSVSDATALLDTANKLATGGVTDITTAVDALTTAVNVYKGEGLTATEASDALFVAMKAGKTTVGELGSSLGAVLPLAQSVGVGFDEVAAGVAALTKGGISTQESVTGLRAILAAVVKPSKEASDTAKALGIQFDSAALASKGLAGFLGDIATKTGGSSEALSLLFGGVEAIIPAMALAGQAGVDMNDILGQMANKAGATDEAFQKIAEGLDKRLAVQLGLARDGMLTIGNVALSGLVPAMEALSSAVRVVGDNLDIAGAALVGLAATTIPAMVASLTTMTGGLGLATIATNALTFALGALRTAIAIAGGPWGILAGAVASAAAYFLVFRDNAAVAETSAYNVATAEAALRGELEAYATSSSPAAREESRKRVIAHYETAKAALTAAQAELALAEALGENIQPGSLMDQAGPEEGARTLDARRDRVRELAKNAREMAEAIKQTNVTGGGGATIIPPPSAVTPTTKAVVDLGKAGGAAGKKIKDGMTDAEKEAKRLADTLANNVSQAINKVVDSGVDWMLDGFRGGFKGLLDIGKQTIRELVALFLKNSFTVRVGLGVSGGVAGATAAAASSGSSMLSGLGLLGNISSWTSGFIGGITGPLKAGLSAAMQGGLSAGVKAWTASMNASAGGVFGTASMLGTYVGAGLAGLGIGGLLSGGYSLIGNNPMYTTGIGTAAGFLLGGPIGGIIGGALGGVANALFGRKLKDSGLEGRYVGGDFTGNTYQFYKGGVFRSDKTKRQALDPEMQKAIDETLDGMRISVGGAAAMLGAAENALEGFSTSFKFSTKGMSAEEAQAALQEQLGKISDQMVAQIFGTPKQVASGSGILAIFGHLGKSIPLFNAATKTVYELSDEFKALQVTGETATETLTRLAGALSSANVWMDRLGKADFAGSLAGAGKAWDFAEVFGGTEAMNEAVAAYYGAFYSDGERLAQAKKELGASLNLLGINTLPTSNKQFRDLVDQAFGKGDNELAAKLIQLAPAMAAITDQTEALTDALEDLDRQSLFATRADARYAATAEGYRAARAEGVTADLLVQLIAAVREGNINLSRLSAAQLAELQRAALDPAA